MSLRMKTSFFATLFIGAFGSTSVTVSIQDEIINSTSEYYVAFTVDTGQLFNSYAYDILNDPNIPYLMSQFGPTILRVGGTSADYTYYDVGSPSPCDNLPSGYHCLNMSIFEQVVKLAHNANVKLVFGISVGYPQFPNMSTTTWDSSNAQAFLEYLHDDLKYDSSDIYGWELGNELNGVSQWQFQSNAFYTLSKMLENIWGEPKGGFKLVGCDPRGHTLYNDNTTSYWQFLIEWLEHTCDAVDAVNYHSYVNQNSTAIFTYNGINEQYKEVERFSTIFTSDYYTNGSASQHCQDMPNNMWAGEIAEHNQGGIKGLTDSYWDGFWYLDALGSLATLNNKVFARQTFSFSNYGLLNHTPEPNPDFWTALLFHRLVGTDVLGIKSSNELFRAYAFCTNNASITDTSKHSVTMSFINLLNESVSLDYDSDALGQGEIDMYLLEGSDSSNATFSAGIKLNGNVLKYNNDMKMPDLSPSLVQNGVITLSQQTYGFVVFTQTSITSC